MALPNEASYTADGELDVDAYVRDVAARVRAVDATFTARPVDALAAAYPYLDMQVQPIGTGPFRLARHRTGRGARAGGERRLLPGRADDPAHHVPDRARPRRRGAGARRRRHRLAAGPPAPVFEAIREDPDLSFVEYHEPSFLGLYFNLHPESGTLFVDRNLRQAVAYCFDKPTTAATATDGRWSGDLQRDPARVVGLPEHGPRTTTRSTVRGPRRSSRHRAGRSVTTGSMQKDDRRLSTVVAVRAGYPQRTRWLELVGRAGPRMRHRAAHRRGPVRVDRADARRLPARQRRRTRGAPAVRCVPRRVQHDRGARPVPAVPLERVLVGRAIIHVQLHLLRESRGGSADRSRPQRDGPGPSRAPSTTSTRSPCRRTCRSSTPGPTSRARASGRASTRPTKAASTSVRRPGSSRSRS